MTAEEKVNRVLPLLFRHVKANEGAKEELRRKLFGAVALTDADLDWAAAAGDLTERKRQTDEKEGK